MLSLNHNSDERRLIAIFEKNIAVFVVDQFSDNPAPKFPKGEAKAYCVDTNAENALATAYVVYLRSQDVKLDSEDELQLINKIASSLKRYKNNAKDKSILSR